ncbi:MAG: DUF4328 domain-containing protein [Deltaproteobacteria bacterium]|nr:DUF4328 domain-containing protein [Deltaproteobacteria bacterium]
MNNDFSDLSGLTKFLRILLFLGAAVALVAAFSSFLQLDLLGRDYSDVEADSNDSREQLIGILQTALYLLTVIVFGRWIYKANQNVRSLGATGLRMTPGWAVGYFFVPFMNLWRPYQAMKDLWKASHDPMVWQSSATPQITSLWWTLWLATNIVGQISFRSMLGAEGIDGLIFATRVQLLSEAIDIPLCLVAAALVSQIYRAQEASRDEGQVAQVFS